MATLDEAREHLAAGRLVEGRRAAQGVVKEAQDAPTEVAAHLVLGRAHWFQNARLDAARTVAMGRARAQRAGDAVGDARLRLLGVEVSLSGQATAAAELADLVTLLEGTDEAALLPALALHSAALAGDDTDALHGPARAVMLAPPSVAIRGASCLTDAYLHLEDAERALHYAHAGVALAEAIGHEAWRGRLERRAQRASGQADPQAQEAVVGLVGLASSTAGLSDVAPLVRQVCRATLELLEVDRAFVALRDHEGTLRVADGLSRPGVEPGQPSRHIVLRAMRTGREVVSNDLDSDPSARSASIVSMGLRSVICAPMTEGDHVIGAIYGDSERVTEHELQRVAWLARGLAGVAGVAIGNARRLDRAERLHQEGRERAHDVRNLLNMVRLAAEDIGEDPEVPDWARELSARSAKAARSMQGQLQRLIATGHEPARHPVGVRALTEEMVALAEREARAAGVRIVVHRGDEAVVSADPDELARALNNLLTNAVKYAPGDSEVEVWVERLPDEVRWTVRDHGPGIPDGELDAIFDAGRQGRGALEGFGLGLGIARRIVAAHGGAVRAANAPDGGAVFQVRLPGEAVSPE